MSLKNIFESITPDNIKEIELIRDAMDIFIDNLENNSKWSIDITEVYKSDNQEVKEAILKTYLNALYTVITAAQNNPLIEEKLNGYTTSTGAEPPLKREITEILNDEYLTTNKVIKQKTGIEPIIEYTYNLTKYLQDDDRNATDFKFDSIRPFYFNVEGSLFREVYENIVKPLSHPIGWCYSYLQIVAESLTDLFGVNASFAFSAIEVRCLDGDFTVFTPDADDTNVKADFLSRVFFITGEFFTEDDYDQYVTVLTNKNPIDITFIEVDGYLERTIYFDDGTILKREFELLYYRNLTDEEDDNDTYITVYSGQCSLYTQYEIVYDIQYTDEVTIELLSYLTENDNDGEGVDLQGLVQYGTGTELKDPATIERITTEGGYLTTGTVQYSPGSPAPPGTEQYFTTEEPAYDQEGTLISNGYYLYVLGPAPTPIDPSLFGPVYNASTIYEADPLVGYIVYHDARVQNIDVTTNGNFKPITDAGLDKWWDITYGVGTTNTDSPNVIIPIDTSWNLYKYTHNTHWMADVTNFIWEFVDAGNNTVMRLVGEKTGTFKMRMGVGTNVGDMVWLPNDAGNYPMLVGWMFFEDDKVYWRRYIWNPNPVGYTAPSNFEFAISAPITGVRLVYHSSYSTHSSSGTAPISLQIRNGDSGRQWQQLQEFFANLAAAQYNAYDVGCFSTDGTLLTVNDTTASQLLTWTLDTPAVIRDVKVEFRVAVDGTGDASTMTFVGAGNTLTINPRVAAAVDAQQRMNINGTYVGVKADADDWLLAHFERISSAETKVTISRVGTGQVLTIIKSEYSQDTVSSIQFNAGDGTATMTTEYRNLEIEYYI